MYNGNYRTCRSYVSPSFVLINRIIKILRVFFQIQPDLNVIRKVRRNTNVFPCQTIRHTAACISGNESKTIIHHIRKVNFVKKCGLLMFFCFVRFSLLQKENAVLRKNDPLEQRMER